MANFPKSGSRVNNFFGLNSFNTQREKNNSTTLSNNCVFKIPKPKSPPRLKKCNNSPIHSVITTTNQVNNDNNPYIKEIAERFQILQKLDFPREKLDQKSKEIVAELNALCVDKLREQIILPTPPASIASSIYSENQRYASNNFMSNNVTRGTTTGYSQPVYNIPQFPSAVERTDEAPLKITSNPTRNPPRVEQNCIVPNDNENDSLTSFFRRKRNAEKPRTVTATANKSERIQSMRNTKKLEFNQNNAEQKLSRSKRFGTELKAFVTPPINNSKTVKRSATKKTQNVVSSECSVVIPRTKPTDSTVVKRSSQRLCKIKAIDEIARSSNLEKGSIESITKKRKNTAKTQSETKKMKTSEAPVTGKRKTLKKTAVAENFQGFHELPDDAAFFNDVSSIAGLTMVTTTNTIKNLTKLSAGTGVNSNNKLFFSPFAKTHSTSGLSATSTPLSKTLAKNVLSKRLKKPDIAAEIKASKPRKQNINKIKKSDIVPIANSDNSNSEDEVSDFSDLS